MPSSNSNSNYNVKLIGAVLLSGSFIAILNQTLLATALPPIMRDLNIYVTKAQWLTTVFMLVNGIMIPITAFLFEKFTTRRLFITAMSLFSLGTFLAAISPNFMFLLIARVIQASGTGIMLPLVQTVFMFLYPIEKRGAALGMVGLVIAFAPALGPTISGIIVDNYSWHYIFYLILPIAVLDIFFAVFSLENVIDVTNPRVDIPSIVLSSVGFGGLLYGFSTAGASGWAGNEVMITLAVGVLGLIAYIRRQLALKTPLLEFRVFKNTIFTLATIISMMCLYL